MKRRVLFLLIISSLVYAAITFVNHYNFRAYALDLGYYTQVSQDWISGASPSTAGFKSVAQHSLSSHFDLSQIVFSPFVLLFGPWGLLFIQWASILFGALGIYQWTQYHKSKFSLPILICFLSFFSVFQALAYDYHSTVVACMLLPWYFLSVAKGKIKLSWVLLISFALFREDLALFAAFIAAGQVALYWKAPDLKNQLLAQTTSMAALFLLIILVLMPAFSGGQEVSNLQYPSLQSFNWSLKGVHKIFNELIFQSPDGTTSPIKIEFWLAFLISGGALLFRKPVYLFMLIPIFVSKMLHINPILWGVGAHYSIALAVIIPIGITQVLKDSSSKLWKLLPLAVLGVSFRLMDNPYSIIDRENIRFYQAQHYNRSFDVQEVSSFLSEIPKDELLSSSNNLYPHLVSNNEVMLFPLGIAKANYIVLLDEDDPFPLSQAEHNAILNEINSNGDWKRLDSPDGLTVFKRVDTGGVALR